MASSSKLRSSSSTPNLILSCLNFFLFILASASIAPIIILRTPPTSLGWALLISSFISLVSSFLGFFSQLTHFCFLTQVSFLMASLASQGLGFFALFMREKTSLSMLGSPRDPREAMVLVRLECLILVGQLAVQVTALVLTCAVHWCWVREYEELEAEREAMERKRKRKIEEMYHESLANNVKKSSEVKAMELDDKMKGKYNAQQWVKHDFEG